MEEIIKKIEKLLALAEKNPNEHEAMAAAAKAQELIAKYNVDMASLGSSEEKPKIGTAAHTTGKGYKWRYKLATIISRNFRCKVYLLNRDHVVFYGYENDAKAALSTFSFLFNVGNKLAAKYYNNYKKTHSDTHGVLNMYLEGFCSGISSVLDQQCKALMIVTPKEVEDGFKKRMACSKTVKIGLAKSSDRSIFTDGHNDGRDIAASRHLEG